MALFDVYRDAANQYQRQMADYRNQYNDYSSAYNAYVDPINKYNSAIDTYNTGLQGWKDKNLSEYDRINALRNEEIAHAQIPGIHNQENIDYHAANIQRYLDQLNDMTSSLPTAPNISEYAPVQTQTETKAAQYDEEGNLISPAEYKTDYSFGEFNQAAPTVPEAPENYWEGVAKQQNQMSPEQQNSLYQNLFSRPTTDVLSNEAWSLANLNTPTLSSESGTAYELGNVSRMNNPLYQASPNELTTGGGQEAGSQISSMQLGNLYY